MLLARERVTPLRAIERLVGLQAQEARPPFVGLWSRLHGFGREKLTRLLLGRKAVRATAMRATLHLMTAKDFKRLRPALQPALTQAMQSALRKRAEDLDVPALVSESRRWFKTRQATFETLRARLADLDANGDPRAMAYAVRTHLPLVQVPDDGPWGFPSTAEFTLAESWLSAAMAGEAAPEPLVRRYLAAFGPATPADAQTWSGMKGMGEVFEKLRPRLRVFRDDKDRELFDLPEAPRPSDRTPAPARFLPEYDNLVLSHADRRRVIADEHRPLVVMRNLRVLATFLVDGFVAGTWKVERARASATLVIKPFATLPRAAREELTAEATGLLHFLEADANEFDVWIEKPS
jgi:hypothetical protein